MLIFTMIVLLLRCLYYVEVVALLLQHLCFDTMIVRIHGVGCLTMLNGLLMGP